MRLATYRFTQATSQGIDNNSSSCVAFPSGARFWRKEKCARLLDG